MTLSPDYFFSAHAAIRYLDRIMGLSDECTRASIEVLCETNPNYELKRLDADTLRRIEADNDLDDVRAWLEETPGLREAVATGANSFVSEGVRYVIANGTVVTVKTADMRHLPMTDERRAQNGQG